MGLQPACKAGHRQVRAQSAALLLKNKLVITKNVQKKYQQTCKKINRNANKLAIVNKNRQTSQIPKSNLRTACIYVCTGNLFSMGRSQTNITKLKREYDN